MRTVIVLTCSAVLAACGSSSLKETGGGSVAATDAATFPTPNATSDAGAGPDASNAEAAPDATASGTDDPASDVYPANHPSLPGLTNFGGTVLKDVKIVTVTFAGNTKRDAIRKFDDTIVAGSWYASVSRGYGVNPGQSGGYVELPDTLSGKSIDNTKDLQPMIQSWVTAGQFPIPDENTLYVIYFPRSTTVTLDGDQSCRQFGGYHMSTTVNVGDAGTVEAAYAVIVDCGDPYTETASHEIIEAVTDPHVPFDPTWYMVDDAWAMNDQGGENADVCQSRGPVQADGYSVARSWVNAAGAESKDPCQPTDPGKLYFGVAPATQTVHVPTDPQNQIDAHDSTSYIVVKAGTTKVVDVTVFSEAKLPHDLTLVVGRRKPQSNDVADLGPITTGVVSTLSATTGRNGQKRKLTIQAAATAKPGTYPFVVRAILEQNDYHSWFTMLRVE